MCAFPSLSSHTKIRKITHIYNFYKLTNVLIIRHLVKLCNNYSSPKVTQNPYQKCLSSATSAILQHLLIINGLRVADEWQMSRIRPKIDLKDLKKRFRRCRLRGQEVPTPWVFPYGEQVIPYRGTSYSVRGNKLLQGLG